MPISIAGDRRGPARTAGADQARGSHQRHRLGDEGEPGIYQRRLAVVSSALACLLLLFDTLIVLIATTVPGTRALFSSPAHLAEHARLPLLLVAWACCRGRPLSPRALAGGELVVTLLFAVLGAAPVAFEHADERADLSALLLLFLLLLLRAGLLPASPLRAAMVSFVACLPFVSAGVVRLALASNPADGLPISVLVNTLIWSGAAIAGATLVASTMQRLRTDVKDARQLGQYTLEEKIGEGGMGAVYRARHALLRRPAAIKLLLPGHATEADLVRFEREAQMTSRLSHPNTVSIFDYGRTDEGSFYYVMEYLEGVDLSRLVREEGPLPAARVIHILAQVCGALVEAHRLGLVHRDIKPANIFLTGRVDEPDVVKVVDFGLVREELPEPGDGGAAEHGVVGTPGYLAPETLQTSAVSASVDLYALGAVGYFLLTGGPVFHAVDVVDLLHKHLSERPALPSQVTMNRVPADLEDVLMACLERSPHARPASAAALREALLACEDAASYDREEAVRWWEARARGATATSTSPPSPFAHTQPVTVPLRVRVRREPA